jgi:succinate dehydrogenase / fumarate reductase, membrane anchor subunit
MATTYGKTHRSQAFNWFLHRISGTFLIFMLITHFWVQHYDTQHASIAHMVVTEQGQLPVYPDRAQDAVQQQRQQLSLQTADAAVTPYDVVMLRLADPVYAVLWKGFNILFLIFALHHGFYGLNNVLGDYIRNDMARVVVSTLTWTLALVLLIVGLYSVITAGWGLT